MDMPFVGADVTIRVRLRPGQGKLSLPATCGDLRIPPVPLPCSRRRFFNQPIRVLVITEKSVPNKPSRKVRDEFGMNPH